MKRLQNRSGVALGLISLAERSEVVSVKRGLFIATFC